MSLCAAFPQDVVNLRGKERNPGNAHETTSDDNYTYSLSSESSSSIISKSAAPTPTIIIDKGRPDPSTIALFV